VHALRVAGIIEARGPLAWELLASERAAGAVRGISEGYASVALVFAESREALRKAAEALGVPPERAGLAEAALIALRQAGGEVKVSAHESLSEFFMSRLGLTRGVLYASLVAVTALLSLGFFYLGQALVEGGGEGIAVLAQLGLSETRLKLLAAALSAAWVCASAPVAWLAASAALPRLSLDVLGHALPISASPAFLALGAALATTSAAAGVWSAEVEEHEAL